MTIYADEAPLAEAEADAEGNFVAIFKVEPSAEPRALTLGAVTPEGGRLDGSEEVVMLLPRAPAAPAAEPGPGGRRGRGAAPAAAGARAAAREAGAGRARRGGAPEPAAPEAAAAPEVAATAIVRQRRRRGDAAGRDADGARRVTLGGGLLRRGAAR